MAKKNTSPSFEDSLRRLQEIVEALEKGEITLDDTLTRFEEGMKLVEQCHAKLNEAEKKLRILVKDRDGNLTEMDEDEYDAHEEN